MRVLRKRKARKVRRSNGRLSGGSCNASGSFNTASTKNSMSPMNFSGHQQRNSKKFAKRLQRKCGSAKKRGRAKAGRTENAALASALLGLQSSKKEQRITSKRADTKQLILKLLGDKSIETVRCYDDEANLLQDMDLMILGSTPEEYRRYTKLVREEYTHMNESDYKQMRLKVLQSLLMIPNIFATPEFQSKYELLARTNIKQEIEELKQ